MTRPAVKLNPVFTIGHSTQSLEQFIELLQQQDIREVVDVRTIPRSRHNPQFNGEELRDALRKAGIAYTHIKGLGGLRHPKKESINTAWRNASFRGFADYMQTPEFEEALGLLMEHAQRQRVAIMCAEAVPWRCHRSLIADALTVRRLTVEHIIGTSPPRRHSLTPWAAVRGRKVTYP